MGARPGAIDRNVRASHAARIEGMLVTKESRVWMSGTESREIDSRGGRRDPLILSGRRQSHGGLSPIRCARGRGMNRRSSTVVHAFVVARAFVVACGCGPVLWSCRVLIVRRVVRRACGYSPHGRRH